MKKKTHSILTLSVALVLSGCSLSTATTRHLASELKAPRVDTPRIGDSENRFEGLYGKPTIISKNGFKDYADGQLIIEVHYANGVAESVLYKTKDKHPLGDFWISRILSQNSGGRAWVIKRDSKPQDVWLRTPDCQLIANNFKGHTLVVSTRHFRQWLWDQNGKGKLPPEQPKTSIFYPDCACVFLGQSESKMTTLLGNPSTYDKNAKVRVYLDGNIIVRAQFENGICEAIKYVSTKGKLSDHWVTATLALNSAGVAWVVDEEFKGGENRFVTINGKLHALLTEKGHRLMLYTEELNQKTIKRLNPENESRSNAVAKQLGLQ
jgi:hypothetical protein